jgi:hypothetical protein
MRWNGKIGLVVAVLVLGLLGAACSDDDEVGTGSPDTTAPDGDGLAAEPSQRELDERYVGLEKQEAIEAAQDEGVPWRIEREDDEEFVLTMDYVPDRVNFSVDDGVVTAVRAG